MKKKKKLRILVSLVAGFVLWCFHDFLAKSIVKLWLNSGASFGSFEGGGVILLVLNLVFIGILLKFFGTKLGAFLMVAGAVGNIMDRVLFGAVRDYWDFLGLFWNNLNDWFIALGMLILLIEIWKENTK